MRTSAARQSGLSGSARPGAAQLLRPPRPATLGPHTPKHDTTTLASTSPGTIPKGHLVVIRRATRGLRQEPPLGVEPGGSQVPGLLHPAGVHR